MQIVQQQYQHFEISKISNKKQSYNLTITNSMFLMAYL